MLSQFTTGTSVSHIDFNAKQESDQSLCPRRSRFQVSHTTQSNPLLAEFDSVRNAFATSLEGHGMGTKTYTGTTSPQANIQQNISQITKVCSQRY